MRTIKQLLITVAMLLCSVVANAYDFEVNGIYYNIISTSDLTVEVTNGDNKYSGEVIIPETIAYKSKVLKVTSIGRSAFSGCSDLTSITIPNSVTSIGDWAFNSTGLTSITIPNSVTSIGDYAFSGCRSLKDLRIEDGKGTLSLGHKGIGYGLFFDCPLETLYIGRNLDYDASSYRGYSPFCDIKTLKSVIIGNSVTSIGDKAFYDCTGLTSITIPNSVTSIGDYAFYDCTGLTSITIPNSVTSIGDYAFSDCESLKNVVIGNGVTDIGFSPFYRCESLKKVEFRCAEIGTWFNGTSIEEVVIGNSVTSIIGGAFKDCSSLTNIHLLGKTPPSIVSNTFAESQYATLTIYVPQGSLEIYQKADTWKNFWDIQEFNATGIDDVNANDIAIAVTTNGITLLNADGKLVAVYTVAGALVEKIDSYAGEEIALDKGVYVLCIENKTIKVRL